MPVNNKLPLSRTSPTTSSRVWTSWRGWQGFPRLPKIQRSSSAYGAARRDLRDHPLYNERSKRRPSEIPRNWEVSRVGEEGLSR
jgi:hypothetical protein